MPNQYVVIGLGRFGLSLAKELVHLGQEVLAIDQSEERVREAEEAGVYAVQANARSKMALREAGVQNVENVIIAIGEDLESSILATMICKELEIPRIYAKADNPVHADVLRHIGVERVIFPEEEVGKRLAHSLVTGVLMDYIDMAPDASIMELTVPDRFVGKSLGVLQLRRKYGISVLVIKRGDSLIVSPHGDHSFQAGDILIVLGARSEIERLQRR
ncbi:MAG: TrkA family potassium uptake protein [Firmicutes bacterium]|nr:TrkA family potassium uptake protein [Bacillota bacterium]